MDIEEAQAREAIRDTLSRYNLSGDRGRLDDLLDCFAEEGVLEIEGEATCEGRTAIRSRLQGATEEWRAGRGDGEPTAPMRHHLTTSGIELVSPDRARAWSYFLVVSDIGPDHSGRYVDELRRETDRWRFVRRRVRVEWRSPATRFASTLAGSSASPGARDHPKETP